MTGTEDWTEPVTVNGVESGLYDRGGFSFTPEGDIASVLNFARRTELYGKIFEAGESMKSYVKGDGTLEVWAVDLRFGGGFYTISRE